MLLATDVNSRAAPVAVPASLGAKKSLTASTPLLVSLPAETRVVAIYCDAECVLRFGDSSVVAADSDGGFHGLIPAQAKQEYAVRGDWTHLSLLSSSSATAYIEYF